MENWLNKRAQLSPTKIALTYQGQSYTFAQVLAQAQQRAQHLIGWGVQAHQHIGIFGLNSLDTYYNILALQQVGAVIVFLNTRLSQEELQYQANNAQLKACLVDPALETSVIMKIHNIPLITNQILKQSPARPYSPAAMELSDVASLMYTSGTTGRPKGVLQTYGNHWHSAINTFLNFQITATDSWLCVVPIFHISGFSILLRSLIYGIRIYLEPKFLPERINQLLIHEPVTIISVVPTMLKRLLDQNQTAQAYNNHFRIMFLGGSPIDLPTLKICQKRHIPTIQSYGMTETCSNVVVLKPQDARRKIGSCGQALFSNQIRIAGTHHSGEIQIKSPTLAVGYWRQQPLYQQKFTTDGWYRSGDVGYLDAEGFLYVQGRLDEMFVSGGENIYPNEIENVYAQYPGIDEIVVSHKADPQFGAVPIAYLTSKQSLSASELRSFGRQHLAHYQVPVEFRLIKQFPRTGSGKIQRSRLSQSKFQLL
ncbi:o-succinylbenzoate--CoA ligase [Bombilactobacillus bombi]|uniref:o-succinylbenzoate--CoA ligase n=1 Tax=Bombilactobacillus bombi TaxID=1303590 RepID=UPI0015E5F7FB|nr:o-succinylbenzoate--CoA ligase [Bombilactobacillus bombi]MBA1433953.1 o-succinylbenzoate--CoA ligase [Bombilactobacillus bombi]